MVVGVGVVRARGKKEAEHEARFFRGKRRSFVRGRRRFGGQRPRLKPSSLALALAPPQQERSQNKTIAHDAPTFLHSLRTEHAERADALLVWQAPPTPDSKREPDTAFRAREMAPKAAAAAAEADNNLTVEQQEALAEQERLTERAFKNKVRVCALRGKNMGSSAAAAAARVVARPPSSRSSSLSKRPPPHTHTHILIPLRKTGHRQGPAAQQL